MMPGVWNRYEPGEPQPEPEEPAGTADAAPYDAAATRSRYEPPVPPVSRPVPPAPRVRTGGPPTGLSAALAAVAVAVTIGVGVAASEGVAEPEAPYSDWYECIEEYDDREPGLLTPADLCEIGHERPPGYTEFDDYEFDPFDPDRFDSWSEYDDDGWEY